MKKILLFLMLNITFAHSFAQNNSSVEEFQRKQREKVEAFNVQNQQKVKNFRDSLNSVYADFLAKQWEKVRLFSDDVSFMPMPNPPVYKPDPEIPPIPLPSPEIEPPLRIEPVPQPKKEGIVLNFYNNSLLLPKIEFPSHRHIADISEKSVSDFWKQLSRYDFELFDAKIEQYMRELGLDAWGMSLLVEKMIDTYFPELNDNEKVITQVFLLNQYGYKAKLAKCQDSLLITLSIKNQLSNTSYFTYNNNDKYYVLNPKHLKLSEVKACVADYSNSGKTFDLKINNLPKLNGGLSDYASYLSTYPCMEFRIYAEAPLSKPMLEYVEDNIIPNLQGLTPKQGINRLLKIISNHPYKTDIDNYGYEKWNFAEESIIEPYTDCDDNAILLAQLARHLYRLDVVLLYYQNVHLATAINFPGEEVRGDYVVHDGKSYIICDPTYVNADVGMEMKSANIKNSKRVIIPLD